MLQEYQKTIDNFLRAYQRKELRYSDYMPVDGQRLDNIAQGAYNNPWLIELLLRMNPHLEGQVTLRSGIAIRVPLVNAARYADVNSLPPWDERRRRYLGQR